KDAIAATDVIWSRNVPNKSELSKKKSADLKLYMTDTNKHLGQLDKYQSAILKKWLDLVKKVDAMQKEVDKGPAGTDEYKLLEDKLARAKEHMVKFETTFTSLGKLRKDLADQMKILETKKKEFDAGNKKGYAFTGHAKRFKAIEDAIGIK